MLREKSVLIRSYNNGLILEENLKNLLKEDVEILVMDDYSKDPYTVKIIRRFATPKYAFRLTIWRHRKPYGLGNNFQYLVRRAKGKYFLFLDTDTLYIPNSFDIMLKKLNEAGERVMAVGMSWDNMTNNREEIDTSIPEDANLVIPEVSYAPIHYGVFNRRIFMYYKIKFESEYGVGYGFEDWDMGLKMFKYRLLSAFLPIKWYSDVLSAKWWQKHSPETLRIKERYEIFKRLWGEEVCSQINIGSVLKFFNPQQSEYGVMLLDTRDEAVLEKYPVEIRQKVKEYWNILDVYKQKNPIKYETKKDELIKKLNQILYDL